MVYWIMFWWKGVRRVGREKERREVTRWTVSTTANRRSNLNTINYFHFLEVVTQV